MYSLIRPILFQLDAEKAHALTLSALHWLPSRLFPKPHASKEINALGLRFPHPVGLAAGLDKNGEHLQALAKLGFAFIEMGTLTPRPQSGNPAPRLFRLPEAQAIINRMGFNNAGVEAAVQNIKRSHYSGLLGINIGKNKDTPLQKAAEDYLFCLQKVYAHASYVTVNISSPNTPDLRQLQQSHYLKDLLAALCEEQKRLADSHQRHVPLVVKLSPDENDETLKQIAETLLNLGIEGIIATNTTCSRDAVAHAANAQEQGGLSGPPLFERSTHCLRLLKQMTGSQITLIGVGGINSKETAREKLAAGASLLQIYTGLIYEGPGLIRDLVF